jgi:hypothetical protein
MLQLSPLAAAVAVIYAVAFVLASIHTAAVAATNATVTHPLAAAISAAVTHVLLQPLP